MHQAMGAHMEDIADFIGVPDDLSCSICTGMFVDPLVCPCGHSYCGFCIQQWLESGKCCPLCRASVQLGDLRESETVREQCDSINVSCPWGCNWKGRRDEQGSHVASCPVGQFIDFNVEAKGPLGIDFEILDDCLLVGCIDEGYALWEHNQRMEGNQEKQVRINDQVVQVDGVSGDPELLAYLLRRPRRKNIMFRHPQELAVNIKKGGKMLGMGVAWSIPNGVLTVFDVQDGAVNEYNSAASSHYERLQKNDRIIEVNGVSGFNNAAGLSDILLQAEACRIKFHRPRHDCLCSL
mmetsp:Transcript_22365/g.63452  ORF Transcript_22365/g.63452 Transcript_22365/m.63452 type:complete len:294 (-) Transcript_22365:213-1094(-)